MKKRILLIFTLLIVVFLTSALSILAHPGRTDANGGHWDRKSGTYHFHSGEYAGRGSSGSSSSSEYVPVTPPYDPPTDNPYIGEESNNDKKTSLIEKIAIGFVAVILGIFVLVADYQSSGCQLTIWIIVMLIVCVVLFLLANKPLTFFTTVAIIVMLAYIAIKIKKRYKSVAENIHKYKNSVFLLDTYYQKYILSEFQIEDDSNFEIGEDNLPKDKKCLEYWGPSFTLYKSEKGTKIHSKFNCCSAVYPIHVYQHLYNIKHFDLLCKKCSINYTIPDLSWYEEYLNYQRAKMLQQEIKKLHKQCNSANSKIFIVFSGKNKSSLREANNMYIEMQKHSPL